MTKYKYLEKLDFKLVEESKHFRKFEKEDGSYKETLELNWAWDIRLTGRYNEGGIEYPSISNLIWYAVMKEKEEHGSTGLDFEEKLFSGQYDE